MANVYAVKSGNWSDPTVWNTGALPTSADDVFADGNIITVDQDLTVQTLRITARSGGVTGGYFTCGGAYTITCLSTSNGFVPVYAGSTNFINVVLLFTHNAPTVANLVANVGATARQCNVVSHDGTGALNVTGSVFLTSASSDANGNAIRITSNGQLVVVGGVTITSNTGLEYVIYAVSNATVFIVGNIKVINRSAAAIYAGSGCNLTITGSITSALGYAVQFIGSLFQVTGDTTGGSVAAVYSTTTSSMEFVGSVVASATSSAVLSTSASATNLFTGPLINTNGVMAVQAYKVYLKSGAPVQWSFTTQDLLTDRTLYTADAIPTAVATTNVRLGTVYGAGNDLTGAMAVPPTASVAYGVPVDVSGAGTQALAPSDVWDIPTSSLTASGSIGERVKNTATVDTTGAQIAGLL